MCYDFYDHIRGFDDFKLGKGLFDNPYQTRHEREQWIKGWHDAWIAQIHREYAGATRFIELKRKVPYTWCYR